MNDVALGALSPAPARARHDQHRGERLPVPGLACGAYPERRDGLDAPTSPWRALASRAATILPPRTASRRAFVSQVRALQRRVPAATSAEFAFELAALRADLGRGGFDDTLLARAFALVLRATQSTLGLDLFHTQLTAARVLLDNRLAEMATGEGKTHAAMLAAATAALAGVPVHAVTANPYLAERDATQLAPLYAALGLSVGAIRPGDDDTARRNAYRCDIVYCTASDLIFDYLRDREGGNADGRGQVPILRGLCMAIVDEADSVLIDEARTPFILARERRDPAAEQRHRSALALAGALREADHYTLDAATRRAQLEPLGRAICADAAHAFDADDVLWRNRRFREELIELALGALHLYRRDVHYLVREAPESKDRQQVEIIDPTTGRIAVGRRWSHGLHQLIELKERCPPSALNETIAQLTYQRFFPRYWRLCGLSGTLREARDELREVYGLSVEPVPLRRPCRRRHAPPRLYACAAARWDAVFAAIVQHHAEGRAVLVGTDSVADAQALSARLHAAGLPHQRLDARQDGDEAAAIARAGQAGAITVATNMAGRGTDIALGPSVAARGGLALIACQQNASARIDRQLHGRSARGGEPGDVQTHLALDEGLLAQHAPRWTRRLLRALARADEPLPAPLARAVLGLLQRVLERRARGERWQLLTSDRHTVRSLGFGARAE